METKQTLDERKKELLEACVIDEEKIMNAERNRNMSLAKGCKEMDYYLAELKKLEPGKKYIQLMDEIEDYAQQRSKTK